MALVTISGYPSSGKSRRAEQLRVHLENRFQDSSYEGPRLKVVVISDDSLNISRDVYSSMFTSARAASVGVELIFA